MPNEFSCPGNPRDDFELNPQTTDANRFDRSDCIPTEKVSHNLNVASNEVKGGVKSGLSIRAIIPLEFYDILVEVANLGNLGREKHYLRCPRKPRPEIHRAKSDVALAPQGTRTGF